MLGDDGTDQADERGMNSMLLHVGDTMDPDEVKIPKASYDWVYPAPNTSKGGANFDKVDNPVIWSSSSHHPIFASGEKKANTRLIVSQLAAIQFRQMNTALQYIHTEGGFFSTKGARRGGGGWHEGEHF